MTCSYRINKFLKICECNFESIHITIYIFFFLIIIYIPCKYIKLSLRPFSENVIC